MDLYNSDSDEEVIQKPTTSKVLRCVTDNFTNAAERRPLRNARKRKLPEDIAASDKPAKSTVKTSRPRKNAKKTADPQVIDSDEQEHATETTDGLGFSKNKSNGNGNLPITNENQMQPDKNKRNSFWGRRKVWKIHELLAETADIETNTAKNIVNLFENDNTIPFICRYRGDMVQRISPESLRVIKDSYNDICSLRKRADYIVSSLQKEQKIDEDVREEILAAKTHEELEYLYAPYKQASKGSLADRAKLLGLEPYAEDILIGADSAPELLTLIDFDNKNLDSIDKVVDGICHILAQKLSKHPDILEEIRKLKTLHLINIVCSKARSTANSKKETENAGSTFQNQKDIGKFEQYMNFSKNWRILKPHQTLAINRGEKLKLLSVKIEIPEYFKMDLKWFVHKLFMQSGRKSPSRDMVFEKSFEECYTKKVQPFIGRQIRADLKNIANKAAIDVFARNLKQLLLLRPVKGEKILGIDPGYKNGCKLALISETGDVIETGMIYPHIKMCNFDSEEILSEMISLNKCKLIALGNGVACRETELWLTNLFENGSLDSKEIRYSIVSEQGASIYSCSELAAKELPNMDVKHMSAVSIARRLMDPLSEYVKIDAKHMGIGMYQHDINEKMLSESLNEVVVECVSFVGVDINTASLSVLQHVAGLTKKKAEKIIEYRLNNGPFRSRADLLKVKSIGEKTFEQCAGFIRIESLSLGEEIENLLDCTWVHPESYNVARQIISKCDLQLSDIGKMDFKAKIKAYHNSKIIGNLSHELKLPKERIESIFLALRRDLLQDYRIDLDKRPLFKQGITKLEDLSVGDTVSGYVNNVTDFGVFVDIGVSCNGLIHTSQMKGAALGIGDRVMCNILVVDHVRKRINLQFVDSDCYVAAMTPFF